MAIVIDSGFRDIKLNDTSKYAEGRKEFFAGVMEELKRADDEFMACFIIGRKIEGVGGYFTGSDYVARIVLPEGTADYDENTKTLTFKDDEQFAIFVHEASHFRHLITDRGAFKSPSFEKLEPFACAGFGKHLPSNTKYLEYEAGWRSLYYNEVYKMGPKKLFFDLNLKNMLIYVDFVGEGMDELRKELKACKNQDEVKSVLKRCQKEINKVQKSVKKWSDLDKFKFEIEKK